MAGSRTRDRATAHNVIPDRRDGFVPARIAQPVLRPRGALLRTGGDMSAPAAMEHRQGARCRVMLLARVRWRDGKAAAGLVYDISPDGMFVLSVRGPAPRSCVELDIRSGAGRSTDVSIPGLVVYRRAHGFGLLFRGLDDSAREFVERCLA